VKNVTTLCLMGETFLTTRFVLTLLFRYAIIFISTQFYFTFLRMFYGLFAMGTTRVSHVHF